jgi:hypothetical protein
MGEIRTIQDRIASLIEASPYFAAANVEVIRQYKGDILSRINEKMTELGFGVIVALGAGERLEHEEYPYYEETAFTVTLTESPTANSTGLNSCEGVEEVIAALHRSEVEEGNPSRRLVVTGHAPVVGVKASIEVHQVFVKCKALFQF